MATKKKTPAKKTTKTAKAPKTGYKAKKARSKTDDSGPGTRSNRRPDLVADGCGAHSCGTVVDRKTGKAATDKQIADAEAGGRTIPEGSPDNIDGAIESADDAELDDVLDDGPDEDDNIL